MNNIDFDPLQLFMAILRLVPAIIVIVVAATAIFSFRVTIITDEIERTNIQIAEALMASPDITTSRAIFDPGKLDKMIEDGNIILRPAEKEPIIEKESIARNCRIGYKAIIEDLAADRKWAFGYYQGGNDGGYQASESSANYDVALYDNGKKSVPARLTVIARSTLLTKVGCMIEQAYEFKEIVSSDITCYFPTEATTGTIPNNLGGQSDVRGQVCGFIVDRPEVDGMRICLSKQKGYNLLTNLVTNNQWKETEIVECRYFPNKVSIASPKWLYKKDDAYKKIVIYPMKDDVIGYDDQALKVRCNVMKTEVGEKEKLPTANEEVKSVIICFE